MGLSAPQHATISDCGALASLHHEAYTTAAYRMYTKLWEKCAAPEIWQMHAEIFESAIAAGEGRAAVVVVRDEDVASREAGEVVSYALWKRPVVDGSGGAAAGAVVVEEGRYVRGGVLVSFPDGVDSALMKRKEEEAARRKASLPGGGEGMWRESSFISMVRRRLLWIVPHFPKMLSVGSEEDEAKEALNNLLPADLSWLGTKPGFQGQGAAQRVIKWGLDQADEEGRMCYVSTDLDGPAYRLYEKMGFKITGPMTELELGDLGGEGRLSGGNLLTIIGCILY